MQLPTIKAHAGSNSRPERFSEVVTRMPVHVPSATPFLEGPGPGKAWWKKALSEKTLHLAKAGKTPAGQCVGAKSRTCFEGPFGESLRATGPMAKANPFRFSTKYQDDETDLLYYGYRYYNASAGRWISSDPIGEPGFEIVANRPKTLAERTLDRLRTALDVVRQRDSQLANELREVLLRKGVDLDSIHDSPNLYNFVGGDPLDHVDVSGLWQWGWPPWGSPKPAQDKNQECCDKAPKELAKKALTSLGKKLESAAGAGGDDPAKKALGILNKAIFAIDASQRIKKACSPLWGCDDFERTGELSSCLLCCNSINSLFGKEVAGLAFLSTCKLACADAE